MDIRRTEDQELLAQSLTKCLAAQTSAAGVQGELAALGILGLPLAEEDGGYGGSLADVAVVAEALARALAPVNYLEEMLLAAGLLARVDSAAQRAAWLPSVATGEARLALAHAEKRARHNLAFVETRAGRLGEGYVINGTKTRVASGAEADAFILSARLSGEADAADGLALFLVPANAPGLTLAPLKLADGRPCASLVLQDVALPAAARLEGADPALALAEVHANALAAQAFAVAALMDEALNLTVDYLKTRKQFGVAIGSFQSLQHRAADMFVALEGARSLAFLGLAALEEPPARRDALLSGAKAELDRLSRTLAQQAIQLHGGIGMTMEYRLGAIVRALAVLEQQGGDRTHHLARAAQGSLLEPA